MLTAPFGWEEIQRFYEWEPRFMGDLSLWEARMVLVPAPRGRKFLYGGQPTRGLRFNRVIAVEARELLLEISDEGLWEFVETTGGGYNFRAQRGATVKLSLHALGGAFDSDPEKNPLGAPAEHTALGTEPGRGVVRIMQRRGWKSGGDWARPDWMHGQFADGF